MNNLLCISILLLALFDAMYLKLSSAYFQNQISAIQKSKLEVNWTAAFMCYVVLYFGLYYFILKDKRSPVDAFLFGCVLYLVFDLTNKALFENWTWQTTLMDGLWGGILLSSVTYFSYQLKK